MIAENRHFHFYRYVTHECVDDFKKQGWEKTDALLDTHHGEYAVLMVWPHKSEPPNEKDRPHYDD